MANTPGYNCRITVKIKSDKNGRKRATYWSMQCLRWFPLPLVDAELFLATDAADAYTPYIADNDQNA